ncbi:hypothetical protein N9937_00015 [bacterium]|nr:hypothetical protein [bacterium]
MRIIIMQLKSIQTRKQTITLEVDPAQAFDVIEARIIQTQKFRSGMVAKVLSGDEHLQCMVELYDDELESLEVMRAQVSPVYDAWLYGIKKGAK